MSLSLFGLRVVTGERRVISGPFIEYFCGISYSQGIVLMPLRGVLHRRRTKQSPGFRITKMCCLLRPANGWTDSGTRNERAADVPVKDYLQYRAAADPTKSNPMLLKDRYTTEQSSDQAMRSRIVMLAYELTLEGMTYNGGTLLNATQQFRSRLLFVCTPWFMLLMCMRFFIKNSDDFTLKMIGSSYCRL